MSEIVSRAIAPLRTVDAARFELSGPALRLTPRTALSLSMALHELCTNAAKYGALSNADGRIGIEWRITEEPVAAVRLLWNERGGPPVQQPQRTGFGSRLLEKGLAHELGAKVKLEYLETGLVCEIHSPLSAPTPT